MRANPEGKAAADAQDQKVNANGSPELHGELTWQQCHDISAHCMSMLLEVKPSCKG
jgi:hypothetical protein